MNQCVSAFVEPNPPSRARADVGRALGNHEQGALTPEEVFALGSWADSPEAEALVLSCTDMRAVEVSAALESALGKPVISSNGTLMEVGLERLQRGADNQGACPAGS